MCCLWECCGGNVMWFLTVGLRLPACKRCVVSVGAHSHCTTSRCLAMSIQFAILECFCTYTVPYCEFTPVQWNAWGATSCYSLCVRTYVRRWSFEMMDKLCRSWEWSFGRTSTIHRGTVSIATMLNLAVSMCLCNTNWPCCFHFCLTLSPSIRRRTVYRIGLLLGRGRAHGCIVPSDYWKGNRSVCDPLHGRSSIQRTSRT